MVESITRSWSTNELSARDRLPFWMEVVAKTVLALEIDTPQRQRFLGAFRHRRIGTIGIADVRADPHRGERTRTILNTAPRDDLMLAFQISGDCHVCSVAGDGLMQPDTGIILDADTPYSVEFPSPYRRVVLRLPRGVFAELSARMRSPSRPGLFLRPAAGKLLRQLALSALDELASLSIAEEDGIERALIEIAGAALDPVGRTPADSRPVLLRRYDQALAFIDDALADYGLGRAAIAAELHLSPRSVTRLFAAFGTTPERTIWTRRLEAARRDLADARRRHVSITEIAFAWGFSDAAHFSRRFSRCYGLSPRRFRHAAFDKRQPIGNTFR